jgi:SAM-dependent methyltransferase
MTKKIAANRAFAERLINRFDPSYRHRWVVYDSILARLTGPQARWLDGGCGKNDAIGEFPCDLTVGLDRYRHPDALHRSPNHLVLGDILSLPFCDGAFTMVSLNTVVEHFENPAASLAEIRRVLAPGGHLLIHTTNTLSPLIMLGRLLPEPVRLALMKRGFGANECDVFRTYHRMNTEASLRRIEGFEVVECHAIQDMNWSNRAVFICLLAVHLLTRLPGLRKLRTNLVVLLIKTG